MAPKRLLGLLIYVLVRELCHVRGVGSALVRVVLMTVVISTRLANIFLINRCLHLLPINRRAHSLAHPLHLKSCIVFLKREVVEGLLSEEG